jgi:uncharacterized protein YigA (DUF484 family)
MSPVTQASLPENIDGAAGPGPRGEASELGSPAAMDDAQVADWLLGNPDFFDQHADLLSEVRIRHPHGGRAISLVERQVLVLRERNKALESKMAELIRIGQENDLIGRRLQQLTRHLLCTRDQAQLPAVLLQGLQSDFGVPQVAIRLWGIAGLASPFGDDVSADVRRRAEELRQPYCGPNSHPEAAGWLAGGGDETSSMALLALRIPPRDKPAGVLADAFGLLVLGSDDAARFQAGMGTAFLEEIGEIASASLSRLID